MDINKPTIIQNELNVENLERENDAPLVQLGQWYWLTTKNSKGEESKWFVCVTHIGSNYVELQTAGNYWPWRVHFDNFFTELVYEPNHEQVLADFVRQYQQKGQLALAKIKELTMRLGLKAGNALEHKKDSTGTGLAVLSGNDNLNQYKTDLIKAQEETLPDLFREVKDAHEQMAKWMSADAIQLETTMTEMKSSLNEIKDRIFNVSLYAGLEEHIKQCSEGEPADILEPLHVMQRKLFMDEECLLNYDAGGMEFKDITEFDKWISTPENRDRIMPFSRTLVAMQVRRKTKDRSEEDLDAFIKVRLAQSDKYTYLYVRNGEQVWRLTFSEFEFDNVIFPDRSVYDPSEPKMMAIEGRKVKEFIPTSRYEMEFKEYNDLKPKHEAWCDAERERIISKEIAGDNNHNGYVYVNKSSSPFYTKLRRCMLFNDRYDVKYEPFNASSVYYDDAVEKMMAEIQKYNRIVLIIQGIFDRSPVLAPHMPVQTWYPEGFNKAIKLVYDGENILYAGTKPDFMAYWKQCNAQITKDSVFTGQLKYWMRKEAEKENERLDNKYRYGNQRYSHYALFKPEGNDGMPYVCKAERVGKTTATFKWLREKLRSALYSEMIPTQTTIPLDALFNVSAYKKGDYKQFFADPRTRQEYMKWAPMLLAAEDYLAGKFDGHYFGDVREVR